MKKSEFMNSIEVEEITAEWFDENYIIESTETIRRFDYKGKRHYVRCFDDGRVEFFPSVTTILRAMPTEWGLVKWFKENTPEQIQFKTENSANYGTYLHTVFNRLLRGEDLYLDDIWIYADMEIFFQKEDYNYIDCRKWIRQERRDIKKDIFGFVEWVQDYNIIPLAIEYPVFIYDDDNPVAAGMLDLICKATIKDEEIIIAVDYKTGNAIYKSYGIQLYAYQNGWNREQEQKVISVYNYRCKDYRLPLGKTVSPYEFKKQDDPANEIKWDYYSKLYHMDNELPQPTTEIKSIEINIKTDLSTMIEEVIPEDIFRKVKDDKAEAF